MLFFFSGNEKSSKGTKDRVFFSDLTWNVNDMLSGDIEGKVYKRKLDGVDTYIAHFPTLQIGQGNWASITLGQKEDGTRLALKYPLQDAQSVDRDDIEREAQFGKEIGLVIDMICENHRYPIIVMRYCTQTLRDELNRLSHIPKDIDLKGLEEKFIGIYELAKQFILAVHQLHLRSILHRDINEFNVMRGDAGLTCVDLGVSVRTRDDGMPKPRDATINDDGTVILLAAGNPGYVPKAVKSALEGGNDGFATYSVKTDLYAVGAVLRSFIGAFQKVFFAMRRKGGRSESIPVGEYDWHIFFRCLEQLQNDLLGESISSGEAAVAVLDAGMQEAREAALATKAAEGARVEVGVQDVASTGTTTAMTQSAVLAEQVVAARSGDEPSDTEVKSRFSARFFVQHPNPNFLGGCGENREGIVGRRGSYLVPPVRQM